jgi:hypothetical protein
MDVAHEGSRRDCLNIINKRKTLSRENILELDDKWKKLALDQQPKLKTTLLSVGGTT